MWVGFISSKLKAMGWDWREGLAYDGASYLKAVKELPQYSTVIFNEGGEDLFSQEWWEETSRAIIKSQMTDRVFRKLKVIIIPHNLLLNKGIKIGATARIHCFGYHKNFKQIKDEDRDTRTCSIWWAMERDNPFGKYAEKYYVPMVNYYQFPQLPPTIDKAYGDFDTKQKQKLNEKYATIAKQAKDENYYLSLVEELIEDGSKFTSRHQVYAFYKGSITEKDAGIVIRLYKEELNGK